MGEAESWIVNPCAEVEPSVAVGASSDELHVRAPSRRRGLQRLSVAADDPLYLALVRLVVQREPLAAVKLRDDDVERLRGANVLIRAALAPTPVRFQCPGSPAAWAGFEPVEAPVWSDDARWLVQDPPPRWYRDRRTGIRTAWWGEDRSATPPISVEPTAMIAAAEEGFESRGWARLPTVIPTAQVAATARYFDAVAREGGLEVDLRMARLLARNDHVARFWLRELTPLVSRVAQRPLEPADAVYVSYRSGARVATSSLRAEGWTLLWMLAEDAGRASEPWPLSLVRRADDDRDELLFVPGDGLIFEDARYTVERERLEGRRSVALLGLHWRAASAGPPTE